MGGFTAAPNTGRGPWYDSSRVRVFSYPYFPKSAINPSDMNVIWTDSSATEVQYRASLLGNLDTRFDSEPASLSTSWLPLVNPDTLAVDTYARVPGAGSMATALDVLFQSSLNIWERAWLFCDHSIAAMHLEALRFALERRGEGSSFDDLVRPKLPYLAGLIGGATYDADGTPHTVDNNTLWSDGVRTSDPSDTGVFDSLFVGYRDLQVGDHVILWNHHLYASVTSGAWRLENSFVTYIDPAVDKWDGEIDPAVFMKPNQGNLRLDGFGGGAAYGTFLRALFVAFVDAFEGVVDASAVASGDAFRAPGSADQAVVVRWAPYPTGLTGIPWFIFLRRITRGDKESPYPNIVKMLEVIKHSVADGSKADRGDDYVSPPLSVTVPGESVPTPLVDGVFFPLFLPVVDGKEMEWSTYFGRVPATGRIS
jgi:hypothetical protein